MQQSSSATNASIRRLLNGRVAGLKVSPTVGINDISNEFMRSGKRVYKFGLGQSPFPVPQCVTQRLSQCAHEKDYLPAQGLLSLREQIATYHNQKNDRYVDRTGSAPISHPSVTADEVFVGPGSKELIFILQLCYYGELVLQTPCWVSYQPQALIIGRNIRKIPTTIYQNWKLAPEDLRKYLELEGPDKPRILVLNYPSNPTGQTYTNAELKAIADVSREYGVVVLSDEIYSSLTYDGSYTSISHYYPEGTIILDGISKWAGAGGWRLGYFVFPKELRWLQDGMKGVASETFTSVSAPIQHASIAAFDGHFENTEICDYLASSRQVLQNVSDNVTQRLRANDVKVLDSQGGFYCYGKFTQTKKGKLLEQELHEYDDDMTRQLLVDEFFKTALKETGVAVLPGHYFGSRAERLCFRLSYVAFDGEQALKRPSDNTLYENMYEGVEILGKYLNS